MHAILSVCVLKRHLFIYVLLPLGFYVARIMLIAYGFNSDFHSVACCVISFRPFFARLVFSGRCVKRLSSKFTSTGIAFICVCVEFIIYNTETVHLVFSGP